MTISIPEIILSGKMTMVGSHVDASERHGIAVFVCL